MVSVIIPTYNRAGFISDAVQSVINQTYKNIEIIVVDDGSTDSTKSSVEPFRDKIHYIVTENKGQAHARNTGMKAATGHYIAFLDSDDTYLPYKLELQVSFMEAHPEVGIVATEVSSLIDNEIAEENHLRSFHCIYHRKGWSYEDIYPVRGLFHCETLARLVPYYIGSIFRHVLQGPLLMSNTILFPRELLQSVGYQNEAYHLAEEYELIVRICKHYYAAFLNIPTYIYRYHDNQISMVGNPTTRERVLTQIGIEKVFLQAVLDWGYDDKKYYDENKDWLNRRISELYHCIGKMWLEIGEAGKARENFSKGHSFDPSWRHNLQMLRFSYLPSLIRRGIKGVARRVKAMK
jgi:glycosyltransferase involved in cell wall biosynthesis